MTHISGNINYELDIDPTGEKHGLSYDNKMENDIVGLMIAAQVLTVHLGQWKEHKAKLSGIDKKKVGAIIHSIGEALRGVKPLMTELLNSYDGYIAYQHSVSLKQAAFNQEQGVSPKEE